MNEPMNMMPDVLTMTSSLSVSALTFSKAASTALRSVMSVGMTVSPFFSSLGRERLSPNTL